MSNEPCEDLKQQYNKKKEDIRRLEGKAQELKEKILDSYDYEERQIRSSGKRSQDQESSNKVYTTIKVHTSKNSNFSFKINDPLYITWEKYSRSFVLRCPLFSEMETLWHKVESAGNHDLLNPKNVNLRLP